MLVISSFEASTLARLGSVSRTNCCLAFAVEEKSRACCSEVSAVYVEVKARAQLVRSKRGNILYGKIRCYTIGNKLRETQWTNSE